MIPARQQEVWHSHGLNSWARKQARLAWKEHRLYCFQYLGLQGVLWMTPPFTFIALFSLVHPCCVYFEGDIRVLCAIW